ncbi:MULTISPECIES: hypothetical protein [unclassified Streptomyces]|uniref:hypothetical protein n=1 Tax=unclassified Streptomyces TaxID=2593676 RepID=UPI002259AC8E|nr:MULTISPECIES: hypothetical protein [unclassified Streptomyces]MCX5103951.1 hypothetical protein [Streptomyces sp. NBC_00439]WSP44769.1 hypothetical protein OG348_02360 [Streptomyces sp. NBC_01243]WSX05909.1 hypothetical protein OG355_38640 [Streptomyces sp. NBC_00987]
MDASQIHDPAQWLPESGAGTVVIEHRVDDLGAGRLPVPVTHGPTHIMLDAERAALAALHGNCLTAASVHAVHGPAAKSVTVHAVVLDPASGTPIRATTSGPAIHATRAGRLAGQRFLDVGPTTLPSGPS